MRKFSFFVERSTRETKFVRAERLYGGLQRVRLRFSEALQVSHISVAILGRLYLFQDERALLPACASFVRPHASSGTERVKSVYACQVCCAVGSNLSCGITGSHFIGVSFHAHRSCTQHRASAVHAI